MKDKGYNLTGATVICRYGKIFRGNKVKLAAENGAKAVLLYEDPIRGAPAGQQVYPFGEFLPSDGMQRGSLFTGNGDPLSPLYPSTSKFCFKVDYLLLSLFFFKKMRIKLMKVRVKSCQLSLPKSLGTIMLNKFLKWWKVILKLIVMNGKAN